MKNINNYLVTYFANRQFTIVNSFQGVFHNNLSKTLVSISFGFRMHIESTWGVNSPVGNLAFKHVETCL